MAAMVGGALLYLLFAFCFVVFISTLGSNNSSEIYAATVANLQTLPWQQHPQKTMKDVRGGPQVFQWISKVLVPEIYKDKPTSADSLGHCVSSDLCVYGQGHVSKDTQCAGSLVAGFNNCPSHLGSSKACCEACTGPSCPDISVSTEIATLTNSTSTKDLSWNCATAVPDWLQDLESWTRSDLARKLQGTDAQKDFVFCPERLSSVDSDLSQLTEGIGNPLMMAEYNQVLMGRVTMKRVKLVDHSRKATANAYPQTVGAGKIDAWTHSASRENSESFGDGKYIYEPHKGFNKAGGFVQYLDFGLSKDAILDKFSDLERDHWFDLNQGSFVLEVLFWNANVDRFLYSTFTFEHDFAGMTAASARADALSLSLHDLSQPVAYLRFFLYIVIICLFGVFLKGEISEMIGNPSGYFSSVLTLLHAASLILVSVAVVQYLRIVVSYNYVHSDLPLNPILRQRIPEFDNLSNLARRMDVFTDIVSVTACLIFIRCMSLVSMLTPKAAIFNECLHKVKSSLVAWFAMFVIAAAGFTFTGHLLFGAEVDGFDNYTAAFLTFIQMVAGRASFDDLSAGGSSIGFIYWLSFNLFFLIIFQIMLSVIIKGYDTHKLMLRQQTEEEKSPLSALLQKFKENSFLNRCALPLQALLGTAGGDERVNHELVVHHLDQRTAMPKRRSVVYAAKEDGDRDKGKEENVVVADLHLRQVKNFYPGGMVQFYVEHVTPNGPADEAGVKAGWRLLELHKQDASDPRSGEAFRDPKEFSGKEINADTQKMLKKHAGKSSLPVTLVFESPVALSRHCFGAAFFIAVFVIFALMASRTSESYSVFALHRDVLAGSPWLERSSKQVKSFESMTRMGDIMDWLDAAVLDGEYGCADGSAEACASENGKVRPGWFLWHGVNAEPLPMSITGKDASLIEPLGFEPAAATGLSLGFVPYTKPVGPQSTVEGKFRPHVGSNVGVMNNNYMRLTLQFPCFQENPSAKWRKGAPRILDPNFQTGCADRPCMQQVLDDLEEDLTLNCHDRMGWKFGGENQLQGPTSNVNYTYSEKGTYRDLGGIAVGLGGTRAEAAKMVEVLRSDEVFKRGAASAVFELATYNGNQDLFTYVTVKFSVKATGLLDKEITTVVFPLSFFSMGSSPYGTLQRIVTMLCFFIYVACVVVGTWFLIEDIYRQAQITKALLKPPLQCVTDFLSDMWNVVGVASVVLNIAVIISMFSFMLMDSRFEIRGGVKSWTKDFYVSAVDLNSVDTIQEFQRAAHIYQRVMGLLAVSAVLLFIRFTKYFRAISSLRLVMTTLGAAGAELAHILVIAFTLLLGFAFIFYTCFGLHFRKYSDLELSFTTVFMFLLGEFNVEGAVSSSPIFSLVILPCFLGFFLIFLNQVVAALLFSWRASRRDAEEFSIGGALGHLKSSMSLALTTQTTQWKGDDDNTRRLDTEFWQKLSVLRYVHSLDEQGKISMGRPEGPGGESDELGEEHVEHEEQPGAPERPGFSPDLDEERKRFHKTFKKAHMELASQLSRALPGKGRDRGGGVGDVAPEEESQLATPAAGSRDKRAIEDRSSKEEEDLGMGIIEEEVTEEREKQVVLALKSRLDSEENPTEEIWLDALITVLEESHNLKHAQELFLPPPMIHPRTPKETGAFNHRKEKMEKRLNMFLKWLQEEARTQHADYLRTMADSKERVLKQQSLVLTDYLETLDSQIEKLQEEIKTLERKNAQMRSPIPQLL